MDRFSEANGSGDSDSVFLGREMLASPSGNTRRSGSSAVSPTSLLSDDSSPAGSTCRHPYPAQPSTRSPRLCSNASTVTSSSEASASSSGSSHSSNSSRSSGGWGTLAKHRPLKSCSSNGEDSLLKVIDSLPHTSQSLRHVVSNLARTYDDDVLANVQQFNDQAKLERNSDAPRPHLKLRRQTPGKF